MSRRSEARKRGRRQESTLTNTSQFFMALTGRHRDMKMAWSPPYAEGETSRVPRGRIHLVLRAR